MELRCACACTGRGSAGTAVVLVLVLAVACGFFSIGPLAAFQSPVPSQSGRVRCTWHKENGGHVRPMPCEQCESGFCGKLHVHAIQPRQHPWVSTNFHQFPPGSIRTMRAAAVVRGPCNVTGGGGSGELSYGREEAGCHWHSMCLHCHTTAVYSRRSGLQLYWYRSVVVSAPAFQQVRMSHSAGSAGTGFPGLPIPCLTAPGRMVPGQRYQT